MCVCVWSSQQQRPAQRQRQATWGETTAFASPCQSVCEHINTDLLWELCTHTHTLTQTYFHTHTHTNTHKHRKIQRVCIRVCVCVCVCVYATTYQVWPCTCVWSSVKLCCICLVHHAKEMDSLISCNVNRSSCFTLLKQHVNSTQALSQ